MGNVAKTLSICVPALVVLVPSSNTRLKERVLKKSSNVLASLDEASLKFMLKSPAVLKLLHLVCCSICYRLSITAATGKVGIAYTQTIYKSNKENPAILNVLEPWRTNFV